MNFQDTIAAISTPIGYSGIGIVRISGKKSFPIAKKILYPVKNKVDWASSFKMYYGWIIDPENKQRVDEVLLSLMRAPRTYTRENIVEINCHGGPLPLKKTLELVLKYGARLAEPGEFTKRAFLKGRIDLLQAESVLNVIQAKTEKALKIALNQLKGGLSRKIYSLKEKIVNFLSLIEAELNFPEEGISFLTEKEKKEKFKEILKEIISLLKMGKEGRIYQGGVKAVIVGKPNVGKSTLLNTLLQEERAIVTPIPGTTRDTIEEMVNIDGFPLRIIDTAGLRKVRSRIEIEGVKRTHLKIKEADLILLMIERSSPLNQEDIAILKKVKREKTLLIINKIDLPQRLEKKKVEYFFPEKKIVEISATREINIEKLKQKIAEFVNKEIVSSHLDLIAISLREEQILEKVKKNVDRAFKSLKEELPLELVAFDLREGVRRIGEITGEVSTEDILGQIFSQFCIGK